MSQLRYYITIIACLAALFFCSCENDYLLYDTSQKDAVYIQYDKNETDSIHITYGFLPNDTDTLKLPISLMGSPKNVDRQIGVEVISGSTTAVEDLHYNILEKKSISANNLTDTIRIVFYRNKDEAIKENTVQLCVRLKPTNDLDTTGQTNFKVTYNNYLPAKPRWWSTYTLGPYSHKLAVKIFEYYHQMESASPYTYSKMVEYYGYWFEDPYANPLGGMFRVPFFKHVLVKVYDHFLEYPDPDVIMPYDPRTKI